MADSDSRQVDLEDSAIAGPRTPEILAWMLVALLVRLPGLPLRLIDIGEGFTVARMLGLYNPYAVYPPYFFFLKCWAEVFGYSIAWLRLPSTLASVASTGLLIVALRGRVTTTAVRLAALLFALSPFDVYYAQHTKPYGFVSFLLLMGICFMLRARTRLGAVLVMAGITSFAFLCHYSVLTSALPLLILLAFFTGISWKRIAAGMFAASVLAAALAYSGRSLLMPAEYTFAHLLDGFRTYVVLLPTRAGIGRIAENLYQLLWAPLQLPFVQPPWKIAAFVLAGLVARGLVWDWNRGGAYRRTIAAAISVTLAGPFVALTVQNVIGMTPYTANYSHAATLGFAVLIGAGIAALARRSRALAALSLALALSGSVAGLVQIHTVWGRPNLPDWITAERLIRTHAGPREAMLLGPGGWFGMLQPMQEHASVVPVVVYPDRYRIFRDQQAVTREEFDRWHGQLEPFDGVWVLWDLLDYLDPEEFLKKELATHWVETERFPIPADAGGVPAEVSHLRRRAPGDTGTVR